MTSDSTGNNTPADQSFTVADFSFELPERLIAQQPVEPRDHSRLLVIHRDSGEIEHKHFFDLDSVLTDGDVLVVNETRVIPARLMGKKRTAAGALRYCSSALSWAPVREKKPTSACGRPWFVLHAVLEQEASSK